MNFLAPRATAPDERLARVLAALVACAGCTAFEDLSLAQNDAGQSEDSCQHAVVQEPALINNLNDEREFVVAMRRVDFGEPVDGGSSGDANSIGFDLDGVCTRQGGPTGCRRPTWAAEHPDGPGGRDNSFGVALMDQGGGAAAQVNAMTDAGSPTIVLRVRGYNQAPNDNSVEVALFAGFGEGVPRWDGTDVRRPSVEWIETTINLDGSSTYDVENARFESDRAYVSNGLLVAHLPFSRGLPLFDFSDVWIQARLENQGADKWALREGTFAGRMQVDDLVANLEYVADPETSEQSTCMDSVSYADLKGRMCILADVAFDVRDPSAPCDAVSWAWRFEAEPAVLSGPVALLTEAEARRCAPAVSPTNDHCSTLGEPAR